MNTLTNELRWDDTDMPNEYPTDVKRIAKLKFLSICNGILLSDDTATVSKYYDTFFSLYRNAILLNYDIIKSDCFEDVIHKILAEENNKISYEQHGVKYDAFTRFLGLIKEQETLPRYRFLKASEKKKISLRNYIRKYGMEENDSIKNQKLDEIIHENFELLKDLNN